LTERHTFEIRVPDGRLDLPLCVSSGQVFRWQALEDGRWLGVEGAFWYLIGIGPEGTLSVQSNAGPEVFSQLFRLEWDAEDVEAKILERGPELEPYMRQLRGLRLMRPTSAEETFFCFLCTPNNNVPRITQMVRHLASFGAPMDEIEGREIRLFPDAATVAAIPEEELRARGFGYRARTIPNAARQLLERGDGWLTQLREASYADAFTELVAIDGIGPKLADCIALFSLHHTEAVPIDTHLWQQAVRLYFPEWEGKSLTHQRYRMCGELFRERFGTLAGWAHQYLFYDNLLNWRQR
jgi:N-glycosylase/DNA lyase